MGNGPMSAIARVPFEFLFKRVSRVVNGGVLTMGGRFGGHRIVGGGFGG